MLDSVEGCDDPRLRELMQELVRHAHALVQEVGLTPAEWQRAIDALTATGHMTDERRQEWVLWSDALGLSMLVDAIEHQLPDRATESTVLGPFYVPSSPLRDFGASIAEQAAGVHLRGRFIARPDGGYAFVAVRPVPYPDRASEYLESDAVFAVKPSLVRDFVRRDADDPERPAGIHGEWFSVDNDLVLAPATG